MQWLPYVVAYAGIAVFLIAVIARFFMWARMPIHVRWELYPVAHDAKRARYGGSYFEESKWWTKPREVSLLGELKVMVPEILFLVALKEHNPKLWIRSLPFHFGLYLVVACTVLMLGTGVLGALSTSLLEGGFGTLLRGLIVATGAAGMCLAILGALGLLQRRLTEPGMSTFASGADLFNLVFFVVAFGVALVNFLLFDRDFSQTTSFTAGLVTGDFAAFSGAGGEAFLAVLTVVLLSVLVAYIPLTHMSHFVGKYFAYHAIRWNDKPLLRGDKGEAEVNKMLGQKVSWSAPHIKGEGKKTWVDVATEEFKKK